MYLDYFGFDEPPFSITPDPKFVFLSEKHQESLAHLVYGITRGGGAGFVQLTGEVGTGKTTISRLLLEQIPEKTNIALILNPNITPVELLENIFKELKLSLRGVTGKLNRMVDKLNQYLIKSWSDGENTVVIIDEAQNLPRDTLEQLRLLTNLETDKQKLLQIILIGQPELRETMKRNDLRQLAQRVTAKYHLMPLNAVETYDYLKHRIIKAGGNAGIVNHKVSKAIHKVTHGVPRLINTVADRALLAAYSDDQNQITKKHVTISANEVLPESTSSQNIYLKPLIVMAVIVIVAYLLYYLNVEVPKAINDYYGPRQEHQGLIGSDQKEKNSQLGNNENSNRDILKPFEPPSAEFSWQNYFKLWGTQTDKKWQKAECPNSLDTGLACLRRQGNLKQIEYLNHPVLLQLQNGDLVLLTGISEGQVLLLNDSNSNQLVEQRWLDDRWLGTYFILWSMPAEILVDPLISKLNSWATEMANTISNEQINNSNLIQWLKSFQIENGLLADGIIGPETQMALSLRAYNGPTLNH
jgi:general secretion pathway protein A